MTFDQHVFWYVTRAAGLVAFWLLTISAALGLAISSRLGDGLLHRAWVFELHKFSSTLALGFVGLHLLALPPDPWTDFGFIDFVVPGTSSYRPIAVAIGVVGMYGSIIAAGTFYVKRYLGHRTWRVLHYSTFLTFVLVLVHGVYAGTDTAEPWMQLSYLAAVLLMLFLVIFRILAAPLPKEERATASARALAGNGARPAEVETAGARVYLPGSTFLIEVDPETGCTGPLRRGRSLPDPIRTWRVRQDRGRPRHRGPRAAAAGTAPRAGGPRR
jgi:predicted ferric reductase